MRPCSPAPPTVAGLQLLSWREIEAKRMGGTGDQGQLQCSIKVGASLTPEFATELLEGPKVSLTGGERTALSDGVVEVHGDEVADADKWRFPARALNAAV